MNQQDTAIAWVNPRQRLMDGKYEVGLDDIRALAIQCHAFDHQFDRWFNQPIGGTSGLTYVLAWLDQIEQRRDQLDKPC